MDEAGEEDTSPSPALTEPEPVCNDAVGYWSDDGKSFVVFSHAGRLAHDKNAPSYMINLPSGSSVPELPANGVSDITQFAGLKHVRTIPQHVISAGRDPETYAYVKETVQRNLYRIPLR